jgi:hypothetical protein
MTMQRRHFEVIAETIKGLRHEPAADQPTVEMVAREFARALARTNPRFDADRFVEATR